MTPFLFRFGYCTPSQIKSNIEFDSDDESSMAFFIVAESEQDAENWGCEIAEKFCNYLFSHSSIWVDVLPSWKQSNFSFWIDQQAHLIDNEEIKKLPVINYGDIPDFKCW